jgi:glycosyltransferase involved in cell wall biosynthesis
MTVLRLCLLANPNSIHIQRWAAYFIEAGYEVHLIGEHPLTGQLPAGVAFHDLTRLANLRKLRYIYWALRLPALLANIRPDVLHAHNITSAGWLAAASGYHPMLVTSHGSDLMLLAQRSPTHTMLAKWVLSRADYVTCVSSILAEKARQLGAAADRLEIAPIGVDLNTFHPGEPLQGEQPERGAGQAGVVLSLRAIRPLYHPLDIAAALALVLERLPQVRFIFQTYNHDPQLLKQLKDWVTARRLDQVVDFIPPLEGDAAIAGLIRSCDVAISVPDSDGAPLSVLEAMACQKALILSDIPALHEWAQHESQALFVPPGDSTALSQAILRLLQDGELRRTLGENARKMVAGRADRMQCMRRYQQLYATLAKESRQP